MATTTNRPRALLDRLVELRPQMIQLLERLVRAESPSLDAEALRAPYRILATELEQLDYVVRRVPGTTGGHLYARPRRRRRGARRQLLIGHLDTVWPLGTIADMPVIERDGWLYGPGTADMKGGLVQIVFALRALHDLGLEPRVTPVVFVNADEEVGSPGSTPFLRLLAQGAERAFVLESGEGPQGRLKIARKGLGRFHVTVHGRPSHAGAEPAAGVSAILELSHQVQRLYDLNDVDRGITVNVGVIDGGLRPNVVAAQASATVDVRVPTAAAARKVETALRALKPVLEGAMIVVDGEWGRPPMEPHARNRRLLEAAIRLGDQLGLAVEDAGLVGGGSDANTTSLLTATLDGLGPVGIGSHAHDERADVRRMPERTALLALLLLEPSGPRPPRRRFVRSVTPRRAARVAVLGTDANFTNVELTQAWLRLGIEAAIVGGADAAAWLHPGDTVIGRLDVLPTVDGIEPGLLELLWLERRGAHVLNTAFALAGAHDKLLTARLLERVGIPHPRTWHLRPGQDPTRLRPPLVVKPRLGSWGIDVVRCETEDELRACLEEIRSRPWFRKGGVLLQELVPPVGHDLRLVVAGEVVIGAASRVAAAGEWRTNVSLGGTLENVTPPADARALAVAAARAVGADLVGVDLLPVDGGLTVLELNGAVNFNQVYALEGGDAFEATAAALGLLPASARRARPAA